MLWTVKQESHRFIYGEVQGSTGFQFANHPWGKQKAKQLLQWEYGQKFVPEGGW